MHEKKEFISKYKHHKDEVQVWVHKHKNVGGDIEELSMTVALHGASSSL